MLCTFVLANVKFVMCLAYCKPVCKFPFSSCSLKLCYTVSVVKVPQNLTNKSTALLSFCHGFSFWLMYCHCSDFMWIFHRFGFCSNIFTVHGFYMTNEIITVVGDWLALFSSPSISSVSQFVCLSEQKWDKVKCSPTFPLLVSTAHKCLLLHIEPCHML